ncbi:MAG: hypothetical protein CMN76_19380 [Spirochaetaceae bacterium]|nr:hypothetical protein [Spirochaetaceae bacterium]
MTWFAGARRDYPWRHTHNWFHLLMAELMLRRTRSDQVAPIYSAFARQYRNPSQAEKDPKGVRQQLHGLGLHWRNDQILETIQFLSHRYGTSSTLKQDVDLMETPGIGEYCNSMLRSRLFGEPLAAIDSNVARVFCRIVGEEYNPEVRRKKWLKELAARFMLVATERESPGTNGNSGRKDPTAKSLRPGRKEAAGPQQTRQTQESEALRQKVSESDGFQVSKDPFEINLSFLDLSALICRPGKPRCPECPLRTHCAFARADSESR